MTDTPPRTDQDILDLLRSETYAGLEYLRALRTGQERDDDAKTINRKTQAIHVLIAAWAKTAPPPAKKPGEQLSPEEAEEMVKQLARTPQVRELLAREGYAFRGPAMLAEGEEVQRGR